MSISALAASDQQPMHKYLPLASALLSHSLAGIGLVATDMDGTLTNKGKFTDKLLQALQNLAASGIKVLIVTGRSAGWVSGVAYYLPIAGAIAENGGLFYLAPHEKPFALTPIANVDIHRQQLSQAFKQLQVHFPHIQESVDNRFRITDWTFDVQGFTKDELQRLSDLCQQMGWGFTYSNVQCHIKPLGQDKATGLVQVLQNYFPQYMPEQIVTVGDSPNDESLFDKSYFPISVGVANIQEYIELLEHQPVYITTKAEGEGFCELANYLLNKNKSTPFDR